MKRILSLIALVVLAASCTQSPTNSSKELDIASSVVYELNVRQYTPEGTFAAAAERLPFLKDLGVDIVWIMPPYPIGELNRKGSLGSYYAVRDYCNINPEFGTLADFDAFLAKAHDLGLKVILDWVGNHTSPDHPWVTEKPADWYVRDAEGNTIVEYDWNDIAKLNTSNPEVVEALAEAMLFWVNRGIDGFRCDVAYHIPAELWGSIIPRLREAYGKDGFYMLAEGEETWLRHCGFDATYSWELHHMLNATAQGKANSESLAYYLDWDAANYPMGHHRLAFTSNHDENSWAGTEFERMGDAWKAMTVLCWTLPNTQPLIYTGQEVGYDHRFAFFEKDPLPEYKTNQITDFYRYLTNLKHSHPALRSGEGDHELLSTSNNTLVFRRSNMGDTLTVSVQLEAPWEWSISSNRDLISHVEPPCWWVGMQTPLQLLIHGQNVSSYSLAIEGPKGVRIKQIHKAESPNYIFADVEISNNASEGDYTLVFTKDGETIRKPYRLNARREGSAERKSFGTADAVYLLMPDRYVNGDKTNDSMPTMLEKANPKAAFGRFGGDLQGIIDQLDYIADLGFTTIWSTPVQEDNVPETSYHGYACSNYYQIDPRFGSNYKYREFVAEAHKRGLKVIMDAVTNHSSNTYWWMEDLPFADWVHQWPEYTHSNCSFTIFHDPYCSKRDYTNMQNGWFDRSMVDMNLDNPYTLKYLTQMYIWWTEWADLDGFRVDTVPYNEPEPFSRWCSAVRKEYPNLNIVGEVWSSLPHQINYWQDNNPNPDGFDSNMPSVMDFPLHGAIVGSINTDKENWDSGITKVYNSIANDSFYQNVDNMMIFCGNHDTDHIGDITSGDPAKMKLIFALIGTLRGFPQIFAGDEIILRASDITMGDGGRRAPFPLDWEKDSDRVDVHSYVKTLFNWRKGSMAIQKGKTLHYISRANFYTYFRYTPEELVFVYINNNSTPRTIQMSDYADFDRLPQGEGRNVITGEMVNPNGLVVPAKTALIVEYK